MKWVQVAETRFINLAECSELVIGRSGCRIKRGIDFIDVKTEYIQALLLAADLETTPVVMPESPQK